MFQRKYHKSVCMRGTFLLTHAMNIQSEGASNPLVQDNPTLEF